MNIKGEDLVLEIGPGAYPYWRSDCLADVFDPNSNVDLGQFGGKKMKLAGKPLFKITDGNLPFRDKSFQYIICSHVMEHVPVKDIPLLITEMERVADRFYIEFPTYLYDYVYDFGVHENFMDIVDNEIICFSKDKSFLKEMNVFTGFNKLVRKGNGFAIEEKYTSLCATGQEFHDKIRYRIVNSPFEFFEIIKSKYDQKVEDKKPSFPFLIRNKINKILRKIKKEKKQEYFYDLLK